MIELESSLQQILQKLILKVSTSGQLQEFRNKFQQRKIYNRRQRSYIENEKIKQDMGAEYESQSSDEQTDLDSFGFLSKYQLKSMLKRNLIRQRFDSNKLSTVERPHQVEDAESSRDQHLLENDEIKEDDEYEGNSKAVKIDVKNLTIINEKKPVNLLPKRNLKGLRFVIQELEKLNRQ